MRNLPKCKRKTGLSDSHGIRNPGEAPMYSQGPQRKYNMYLNAGSRPRTTPALVIPQPNYRTYVARPGKTIPGTPHTLAGRFQLQKRGLEMRGDVNGDPAGLGKASQPKRGENSGNPLAGNLVSPCSHVLSTINGNEGWRDNAAAQGWEKTKNTKPMASDNKGYASPYAKKQDCPRAPAKKPRQIALPMREIVPRKLLKQVNRSREHVKQYRAPSPIEQKEENAKGHCQIMLSDHAGKQNLAGGFARSGNDGSHSVKTSEVRIARHATSNNRCCISSEGFQASTGNLQHPLHQSAVRSSQRMISRTAYSEQLSPGHKRTSWGHQTKPTIVTPQLDLSDNAISNTNQRMQGRMLMACARQKYKTLVPPPTAPGALGLVELRCQSRKERLDNAHSCKWADPKESPRIKGWKLGHSKAEAIAKRIPAGEPAAQSTSDGLVVDVEGNRHCPLQSTCSSSDVERLHELLLLCDEKEAKKVCCPLACCLNGTDKS